MTVATDTKQRILDVAEQQFAELGFEGASLRGIIGDHPNEPELLRAEVEEESAVRPFARYYARVFDEFGKIITETAGMKDVIPTSSFPHPIISLMFSLLIPRPVCTCEAIWRKTCSV